MVLEQLYSSKWIEQKCRYAFLMGLTYSIVGIASALLLFPKDPGLAAIAFTSLLIVPSLNKIMSIEQKQAAAEEFSVFKVFTYHSDVFKVYLFLFFGIMASFAFFSLAWPSMVTSKIFEQQVNVLGAAGQAYYSSGVFGSLLVNNLKVLVFCLIASLVYGAGSIFVITWTASVWGTVFAIVANNSAHIAGQNPVVYFLLTMLAVFPHMFLEAAAYFIGSISGGIVSKAVVKEKAFSERFNKTISDGLVMFVVALIILVIAVYIEANFAGKFVGLFGLR
jgi:hypothetical protein